METLSRWLENKGVEAEEKALDYLNKNGLFGKNNKLRAIDQIKEIEKAYARDLYFKDCERKLKNNIRQNFSKKKNPDSKPYTFKLSNNSRQILENIRNHYGLTAGQALERLIYNENARLLESTNQLAPYGASGQSYGTPGNYHYDYRVEWGTTPMPQHDVWGNEFYTQTQQALQALNEKNNNELQHTMSDDRTRSGLFQNADLTTQGKRDY